MDFKGAMAGTDSANIGSWGYDEGSGVLRVAFRSGAVYDYGPVTPEKWKLLSGATSGRAALLNVEVVDDEKINCEKVTHGESKPVRRKTQGDVEKILRQVKHTAKFRMGISFLAVIWYAAGRPITQGPHVKKDHAYFRCLATIAEASGCNQIGMEHLDAAIKLAEEKGL